jgi:hypothetical protein
MATCTQVAAQAAVHAWVRGLVWVWQAMRWVQQLMLLPDGAHSLRHLEFLQLQLLRPLTEALVFLQGSSNGHNRVHDRQGGTGRTGMSSGRSAAHATQIVHANSSWEKRMFESRCACWTRPACMLHMQTVVTCCLGASWQLEIKSNVKIRNARELASWRAACSNCCRLQVVLWGHKPVRSFHHDTHGHLRGCSTVSLTGSSKTAPSPA